MHPNGNYNKQNFKKLCFNLPFNNSYNIHVIVFNEVIDKLYTYKQLMIEIILNCY